MIAAVCRAFSGWRHRAKWAKPYWISVICYVGQCWALALDRTKEGTYDRSQCRFPHWKQLLWSPAARSAGFAQNLGGKNVTVGGQSFDFISIITYVAGVLAIIACIVPFVSAFGYSASLFQGGDGWIVLVAVLAIAALTFFKKHLPAMIISALVLVLSIFEMVYSKSKINSSLDEFGSNYGSLGSLASGYAKNAVAFGIGAYLLVIAALGLIVGTVLAFVNQKKAAKVAVPGVSAQPQYVPTAFPGAPVPAPAAPVSDAGVPQAPAAPQTPTAPVAPTAYEQPAPAAPVYQQPDSDASYPGQTPQA